MSTFLSQLSNPGDSITSLTLWADPALSVTSLSPNLYTTGKIRGNTDHGDLAGLLWGKGHAKILMQLQEMNKLEKVHIHKKDKVL